MTVLLYFVCEKDNKNICICAFMYSTLTCRRGRGTCMGNTPWRLSNTWNSLAALLLSPVFSSHRGMTPPDSLNKTAVGLGTGTKKREGETKWKNLYLISDQQYLCRNTQMDIFHAERCDFPTCRCGITNREGGQCGVQAIDSIAELLSKEDMALHWLAGQSMELLPPEEQWENDLLFTLTIPSLFNLN